MKFYRLTLLLFFSFLVLKLESQAPGAKSEDPVKEVMEKLGCSQEHAENFLVYVSKRMEVIEIALNQIASTNTSLSDKQKLIDLFLDYIAEEDAVVMVSSVVHKGSVTEYSIKEYLYYLSQLSAKYEYETIDLFFDPKFLNLSGLEYKDKSKNIHEIIIDVKQYFVANTTSAKYKDLTFKTFKCNVYESVSPPFLMKLQSVWVKETLDVTAEELATVRKEFKELEQKYLSSNK